MIIGPFKSNCWIFGEKLSRVYRKINYYSWYVVVYHLQGYLYFYKIIYFVPKKIKALGANNRHKFIQSIAHYSHYEILYHFFYFLDHGQGNKYLARVWGFYYSRMAPLFVTLKRKEINIKLAPFSQLGHIFS